ncbi:hypothetical protein ACIQ1D_19550 [Lysinibacillus xylanilyticus]|uniref:hypothetical protein n=1 Tax=Lysinibacillus xylanilyticus TaxID=582475 RepID=UPI0038263CA4
MKILLPHKTVSLDSSLDIADKKKVVENLLSEKIEFHAQTMTLEEYLSFTWEKQNSKVIMDMLAYYLTKEEKNLEILSKDRQQEMLKGSYRGKESIYTSFETLSEENKDKLGIDTKSDEN